MHLLPLASYASDLKNNKGHSRKWIVILQTEACLCWAKFILEMHKT